MQCSADVYVDPIYQYMYSMYIAHTAAAVLGVAYMAYR